MRGKNRNYGADMAKILLVEDDRTIGEILSLYLGKQHEVVLVDDGIEAAKIVKEDNFDLLLLDLMLPGLTGETLAQLASLKGIPFIIVTAKNSEEDMLNGLKLGAIDYITKPFSPRILVAKVENFFSRDSKTSKLNFHLNERELVTDKKKVYLTPIEAKLINFMLKNRGSICKREELLSIAWEGKRSERIVDATIKNLRKKLEGSGIKIKTVTGLGYTIEASEIIN
ncbi:MAG: response regulator transcription factor [Thermotogae bacterium]|jgi:DNA-binding response OmpR family regulator|nr:response regulator transcription factor [Thermotogota bacterium]